MRATQITHIVYVSVSDIIPYSAVGNKTAVIDYFTSKAVTAVCLRPSVLHSLC